MRRSYAGAAQAAQLTTALGGSTADRTIYCTDCSNWPTGTGGFPFFVVIDRGKATEEKILCSSRTGNVLTVYDNGVTNGRAADGTSITSHAANAVIEHCFTATDADEANAHVNASSGVHGISGSVVGTTDTQTLTGKTISGASNTLSNIAQAAVANLTTDLASKAPINVVVNPQTGTSYTLVIGDVSKVVEVSNTSANTVTVPPNSSVAFPVGAVISVMQTNTGTTTIVAGAGVTINADVSLILSRWSMVTLIKRGTDSWSVQGGGAVPKARVASSTASSTSSVTISGESYTVYRFTGAGSITFDRAGLVDVLLVGGGGTCGGTNSTYNGAGGAGGWVEKTSVYVPAAAVPVRIGAGQSGDLLQSNTLGTSEFNGLTAVGGAPGAQYNDRQPGGGACAGNRSSGIGQGAPMNYQGLVGASLRGGNAQGPQGGYGGGVADDSGNPADPGANWGNPGSKGAGGNKRAGAANSGDGGSNTAGSTDGSSGIVLIRVGA